MLKPVKTPSGEPWTTIWPEKARERDQVDARTEVHIGECVHGYRPWPLLLWGDVGSGKTCAALTVCDWAGNAAFYTQSKLCEDVRKADRGFLQWSTGFPKTVGEVWAAWKGDNIAVLDEVGEDDDKASDFQKRTVKRAIDLREDKPLIVISNRSVGELAMLLGEPIASRISGGTVVHCVGDRRMAK